MLEIPQLKSAERPAILFSGGKDSLLLLDIVRRTRPDTTVIHFHDRLDPSVEQACIVWSLNVLSWAPAARYLIPWNAGIALVSEYSIGNSRLPVLRDVIEGEGCDLERLMKTRTLNFDYPFDLTLWGYRKSDELHPVMPSCFPKTFRLGPTVMLAPLYEWETEDVVQAVSRLPFKPVSDTLVACSQCREVLKNWDRETTLEFFARRFGYVEAA